MTSDPDLVVIGGGPVGLVTALYAVRAGLVPLVLEPRTGVIDKACGEGLMPPARAALASLGIEPAGHRLTGIHYTDGSRHADADFRHGQGLGVRRTTLHGALMEAVEQAGVQVRHSAMSALTQDRDRVVITAGEQLRAPYVVAADGLHSPTRRALGLRLAPTGRRRHGIRQHLRVAPWTDRVEVHWGPDAEAYVTPVSDDVVGVAVLTQQRASWRTLMTGFPELWSHLAAGELVSSPRGAGSMRQSGTSRRAGRVLLVGDAGGYVDALTGEGLSAGFAQARVAVAAIASGRPTSYPAAARAVSWRSTALTRGLLAATGPQWGRAHLVGAAAALPWLFQYAVNELATAH